MGFKPNFEINFRPSASSFKNDTEQGLTHTAAGLSTEFIILGEETEGLEAAINPYGDDDFLEGEGRIRDKVRKDIQQAVRDLFGSPKSSDCDFNESTANKIREFMSNIPSEVGRKMSSKARRAIASQEAQVQLENFEAAIASNCIAPEGEEELSGAEKQLGAAQDSLTSDRGVGKSSMQGSSMLGDNALIIIGGAVLIGGVLFFAIKK